MQPPLAVARFLDRMDLRPKIVRAQKIVGDRQPPGWIPL
jgi:hypothetical protein